MTAHSEVPLKSRKLPEVTVQNTTKYQERTKYIPSSLQESFRKSLGISTAPKQRHNMLDVRDCLEKISQQDLNAYIFQTNSR